MVVSDFGPYEWWLPVVGFESFYEVSNLGRVKSLPRHIRTAWGATKLHPGGIMTPVLDKDGYPRVILRIDGQHHTRKVHRLVCEAFHGDKRNALHREVDHIDGDRTNARANNLRWVSHAENLVHSHRLKPRVANRKLTEEAVREIRRSPKRRGSTSQFARQFGVGYHVIYDVLRRKTWRHVA